LVDARRPLARLAGDVFAKSAAPLRPALKSTRGTADSPTVRHPFRIVAQARVALDRLATDVHGGEAMSGGGPEWRALLAVLATLAVCAVMVLASACKSHAECVAMRRECIAGTVLKKGAWAEYPLACWRWAAACLMADAER